MLIFLYFDVETNRTTLMQLDFEFNNQTPRILTQEDGEAIYYPSICPLTDAPTYFAALQQEIAWQQDQIRMFGKSIDLPRLTAWYGDPGKSYTYSGITMQACPWTKTLLSIKKVVEQYCSINFNSVLLNLYRNERDSMSWHSDDEPELGAEPIIASVSFGAIRKFHLKHKSKALPPIRLDLENGSLLIMQGKLQEHWKHQVPKSSKPKGPRINLTFRVIQ